MAKKNSPDDINIDYFNENIVVSEQEIICSSRDI